MISDTPDKQDMLLAFGYETAREIIRSDGRAHAAELDDLARRFPLAEMEQRGLLDQGRPTAFFGAAYNRALSQLKGLLSHDEKLQLAQAFFEICSADDAIEASEIEVVVRALATVGVSRAELVQYLRAKRS